MDQAVLTWVVDHRTPRLNHLARSMVRLDADTRFLVAVVVAALLLAVATKAWRTILATPVAFTVTTVLNAVLKDLIGRPRPPRWQSMYAGIGGWAMPSSHASRSAAVVVVILLTLRWRRAWCRRTAAVLAGAALAVTGVALVYTGTHWTTDVLAGWGLGGAVAFATAAALDRWLGPDRPAPVVDDDPVGRSAVLPDP